MDTSYDAHVAKKQRTMDGVREYDDATVDRRNPEPSPVVHVRSLPIHANEDDLISAVQHFGTVEYVVLITRRNQALVEFSDVKGATACVNFSNSNQLLIGGQPAFFNYSTSKRIQRPSEDASRQFNAGNKILLFTVASAKYPITVDVMHTICSSHGHVEKIVIFRKQFVQALVQFDSIEAAKSAKEQLQGCDIYSGCCTLRAEYAKTDELNVRVNNSESWDYTITQQTGEAPPRKNAPLLADPRFTAQPTRFDEYDDSPADQGFAQPAQRQSYGGFDAGDSFHDMGGYNTGRGRGTSPRGRGMGRGQSQYGYGRESLMGYGQGGDVGYGGGYMEGGDNPTPGCVLMLYGLCPEKMNCERIFNIFCLYGNVCRIKFLKTKEGSAMVQMADMSAIERAVFNLNGVFIFDQKLVVSLSKQQYLQVVNNPYNLPDGSPSYRDFTTNKNNRFSTPDQAAKNRIIHPTEILHFFNAPPKISVEELKQAFIDAGAKAPTKVLQFGNKGQTERSATGLVEWTNKQESMEALVITNHTPVTNPDGGRPYYIKLCFSPSNIRERNPDSRTDAE